jgi:subtilisin family serine protease
MKKISTLIFIFIISTSLFSQSSYQYQGQKIQLRVDSSAFVIQTKNQSVEKQNSALEMQLQNGEINSFQKMPNDRFLVVGNKLLPGDYDYSSNLYRNDKNGIVIILPRIAVMFKQGGALQSVLDKYEGKLVKESGDGQKFILKCVVTQSDEVFKLVNELDRRDDIEWCEPEFLSECRVENTLYPLQYYLRNTCQNGGTSGIDINVEPAWNITNGETYVTVAVIDVGVDRNHEDMGTRVLDGYTIGNPTGGGLPQYANDLDRKFHGMACAGIIAASNNTIGIRGIASNVNILPVNIVPHAAFEQLGRTIYGFGSNFEMAQAISWDWRRADILSCSLGFGEPSNEITVTIDSARTLGRNGRGCVVVCASGNNWPIIVEVAYPARLNGVIAVGAINNQGTIWNYSQRGASMDLVAPSGNIGSGDVRTTDRMGALGANIAGNYLNDFGGTSAACPQVAGVAALMLSVRPDLTESQIRTTLQNTARDLGPSGFDSDYGYGLVDAYAAVQAVSPYISGSFNICSSGATYTINNLPPETSISWTKSSNLTYVSGQNTNSYVVQSGSIGNAWVQATIITSYDTIVLPAYSLWSGPPVIESTEILALYPGNWNNVCVSQQKTVEMNFLGESSVVWEKIASTPSNISWYQSGNNLIFYFYYINQNAVFRVSASNSCGTTTYSYGFMSIQCGTDPCDPEYLISPNPASGIITIVPNIPPPCDEYLMVSSQITQVKIYDVNGSVKKSLRYGEGTNHVEINTSDLRTGRYYLEISNGKKSVRKTVIISQ